MNRTLLSLAGVAVGLLALPLALHAAAPDGSLIKGTTSASVYYLDGGKRYAFPNERVYKSWYTDFSGVMTVSDAELASYQLAGNVTYRPGTRLVKIQTDPKVYAVSRYGVLRWVTTEQIAALLYGDNWNTKVDDVADTFFTNYLIGQDVTPGQSYAVVDEITISMIKDNIRPEGFVPPGQAPMPAPGSANVTVGISSSQATLNQQLLVFANVANVASVAKIEIYRNGQATPLATCLGSLTCSTMFTVSETPLSARFSAIAYDAAGMKYETASENQASLEVTATETNIQIGATPLTLTTGSRATFNSDARTFPDLTSHKIYAHIPGEPNPILWQDCGIQTTCSGSTPFYRTTQLYSVVMVGGQTHRSASVTISVSGGTVPKPTLTLLSRPQGNQAVLRLDAPSGETIGWSTIVDGTSPDDMAIALCDLASCEVTIEFTGTQTYTGFTDVGGKLEASNSITVEQQ